MNNPCNEICVECGTIGESHHDLCTSYQKLPYTIIGDVDGVFSDFYGETIKSLKKIAPHREWSEQDLHDWEIYNSPQIKEHKEALEAEFGSPGWTLNMGLTEKANESFEKLKTLGDLVVVTGHVGRNHFHYERMKFLEERFNHHWLNLIFAARKELVFGNALIDDSPLNVRNWKRRHSDGLAILFSTHANRNAPTPNNVIRTNDWDRIFELIRLHKDFNHEF